MTHTHITFWNNIKSKYPDAYNNWCPNEFKKQKPKQFHFPKGVFQHILGFIGDHLPPDTIKFTDEDKEACIQKVHKRRKGEIITKKIWTNICPWCKCRKAIDISPYPDAFYGCQMCRKYIGHKGKYTMNFGKHKGSTWREMAKDKGYVKWFIKNVDRKKCEMLYDFMNHQLTRKNKPKLKYFINNAWYKEEEEDEYIKYLNDY